MGMGLRMASLLAFMGLTLPANGATIEIETCDDLADAVSATSTEDTTGTIITSAAFACGIESEEDGETNTDVRTLVVENHVLTIEAPGLLDSDHPQFFNLRFQLHSAGELYVVPSVQFLHNADTYVGANGGWLSINESSTAHFLGDVEVDGYGVRSETEEDSDFSRDQWDGGCVWNKGYLWVEGHSHFSDCENVGGGESPPGRGGVIFNTEMGSILFGGGVTMEDTSISDDNGNDGGGIYNLGKIDITGNSLFDDLVADPGGATGGAVYNAEGAEFTFSNEAYVAFTNCAASDGAAIYNAGEFRFDGPALFSFNNYGTIVNTSPGYMELSSGSSFWFNDNDGGDETVSNLLGATLDYPDDLTFVGNGGSSTLCDGIYIETNDGYTCAP